MRNCRTWAVTLTLCATALTARADHPRPGIFTDVGTPPATEDVSHANVSTKLMIERCNAMIRNMRVDQEGHVRRFRHNYNTGFCLGWINASMVFLNVRDASGSPSLGVCLPDGIHTREIAESFLDFAKRNPDDQKYNPSFLIYWAMLEKHSCKK